MKILKESVDVFAWEEVDMIDTPIQLVDHKLYDKLGNKPIQQKEEDNQRIEKSNKWWSK